jgi:hypothetical protein
MTHRHCWLNDVGRAALSDVFHGKFFLVPDAYEMFKLIKVPIWDRRAELRLTVPVFPFQTAQENSDEEVSNCSNYCLRGRSSSDG